MYGIKIIVSRGKELGRWRRQRSKNERYDVGQSLRDWVATVGFLRRGSSPFRKLLRDRLRLRRPGEISIPTATRTTTSDFRYYRVPSNVTAGSSWTCNSINSTQRARSHRSREKTESTGASFTMIGIERGREFVERIREHTPGPRVIFKRTSVCNLIGALFKRPRGFKSCRRLRRKL